MGSPEDSSTSSQPLSDSKSCNILQPCNIITEIAQDASFKIQTALLWRRSGGDATKRMEPTTTASEVCTNPLSIQVNSIAGPIDCTAAVREDHPELGLLSLHRDRLAAAAEAFGWRNIGCLRSTEEALSQLRRAIERHLESRPPLSSNVCEVLKVRVLIDRIGRVSVDSAVLAVETPPTQSNLLSKSFMPTSFDEKWKSETPPCKVYLDHHPTRPSTLTTHKTSHRCVYTSARERLSMTPFTPPTSVEVLLYNPYGEITETSFCTVYFKRNGAWITPAAICGPNIGVSRRLALENGLCTQGTIELGELKVYEEIWLSNAVRGFFKGVLITDAKRLSQSTESKEVLCAKLAVGVASEK